MPRPETRPKVERNHFVQDLDIGLEEVQSTRHGLYAIFRGPGA